MKKLISLLELVRAIAKDIHYDFVGENFYSVHQLMDKVQDELTDFQDEIKENYFMCNELPVPTFKSMYEECLSLMKEEYPESNLESLKTAIRETIAHIEAVTKGDGKDASEIWGLTNGDIDLLGRISSNLRKSFALVSHVRKE